MHSVGPGDGKGFYAPLDRMLHGGGAGHAATDFVGQVVQVAFERGRLKRDLNDVGRIVGFRRRGCSQTNSAQEEAQPQSLQVSHVGCIRNEIPEKSKAVDRKDRKSCVQGAKENLDRLCVCKSGQIT
jgi:hypothetical protein